MSPARSRSAAAQQQADIIDIAPTAAELRSAAKPAESRQALLDWALAAGLLAGEPIPAAADGGKVLELVGSRITLVHLGELLRVRMAELILGAKSGTEVAALIRALIKVPNWLCHPSEVEIDLPEIGGGYEAADEPDWLAGRSFEELIGDTKRLLAEIEAEQSES